MISTGLIYTYILIIDKIINNNLLCKIFFEIWSFSRLFFESWLNNHRLDASYSSVLWIPQSLNLNLKALFRLLLLIKFSFTTSRIVDYLPKLNLSFDRTRAGYFWSVVIIGTTLLLIFLIDVAPASKSLLSSVSSSGLKIRFVLRVTLLIFDTEILLIK